MRLRTAVVQRHQERTMRGKKSGFMAISTSRQRMPAGVCVTFRPICVFPRTGVSSQLYIWVPYGRNCFSVVALKTLV